MSNNSNITLCLFFFHLIRLSILILSLLDQLFYYTFLYYLQDLSYNQLGSRGLTILCLPIRDSSTLVNLDISSKLAPKGIKQDLFCHYLKGQNWNYNTPSLSYMHNTNYKTSIIIRTFQHWQHYASDTNIVISRLFNLEFPLQYLRMEPLF